MIYPVIFKSFNPNILGENTYHTQQILNATIKRR